MSGAFSAADMLFLPGSGDSGKRLVEDHRLAVLFLESLAPGDDGVVQTGRLGALP